MNGWMDRILKINLSDGGRAQRPVYLVIEDDKVTLRDSAHLWGKNVYTVEAILKDTHGAKARFATTGIAGENLVRTAIIFGSPEGSVSVGFGAVLASKKLKAIVVKGSGRPSVADPRGLRDLARYTAELRDTCDLSVVPRIDMTNRGHLLETVGKRHCYLCLDLLQIHLPYGKESRLEGLRGCQAMEYYLPWTFGREDEPVKTLFDAPTLANDYSIDTFELQSMIDWLFACLREGIYADENTGLPLSKIGTREFLEKLLHAVTGMEAGELDIFADRIFNMQRLIRVREGHSIPENDYPPEFNFTEPLFQNIHSAEMNIPGPGAKPVSATGNKLDLQKFRAMLQEYYELRGWNKQTGLPTAQTLSELGMDDLISFVPTGG